MGKKRVGALEKVDADLPNLQYKIRRDPKSYSEDFLNQYGQYQSQRDIFLASPGTATSTGIISFRDLIDFIAHVADCFPEDTAQFPEDLKTILTLHHAELESELREKIVGSLVLLRRKDIIDSAHLLNTLFPILVATPSKTLRTLLFQKILSDLRTSNSKSTNHRLNRTVQMALFNLLTSDRASSKGIWAVKITRELWKRQIWTDSKAVEIMKEAALVDNEKVIGGGVRFFLGGDKEREELDDESSDDEGGIDIGKLKHQVGINKKTKKKAKTVERAVEKVKKAEKKKKQPHPLNFSALHLLHDPQGFAEMLFSKHLQNSKSKLNLEQKLLVLQLVSRLVGLHKLTVISLYSYFIKYLTPRQQSVTSFLASLAQATHNLVPPDALEPLVQKIANEFVSEASASEVASAGLNAIREICVRQPLAMNDTLLQDLVMYRKSKDKGTMMAAKGLLSLYREVGADLLKKRDRGKTATIGIKSGQIKERRFGEEEVGGIEGLELLEQWKDEERKRKRVERGLPEELGTDEEEEDEEEQDWNAWDVESDATSDSGGWINVESNAEIEISDSEDDKPTAKKVKLDTAAKIEEKENDPEAQGRKISKLATTKVLTPADLAKLQELRLQSSVSAAMGHKNSSQRSKELAARHIDDPLTAEQIEGLSKMRKSTKEEMIALAREGKGDRGEHKSTQALRREKKDAEGKSTTNKEKARKKNFMMTLGKAKFKQKRSLTQTRRVLKGHIERSKRGVVGGPHDLILIVKLSAIDRLVASAAGFDSPNVRCRQNQSVGLGIRASTRRDISESLRMEMYGDASDAFGRFPWDVVPPDKLSSWIQPTTDRRLGGPRLNAATPRNPLERIDRLGTGQEGPDRLGGCLVCPFLAATQFFASRRPREVEGQSDSSHRRTWWTRDSKLAMAWDHLAINRPHLVYIILGGFTSLFMLCSSFIKERLYIGEATVATICGVIFGPHAANLINPLTWGNTDQITLEFSRIVLVVQCFAVGVELPKYYMEKHWRSVVFLLIPVMTFGWLITSLFVWWMIPNLNWLSSLCVAACVTATDPVLASSVVGKGKFAKRVPKHLRDVLSAESGCNDGMAFPFIYLALYLIEYSLAAGQTTFHWIVITILYECVFGAIYGFCIGYIGRHGIKWAEKHDLVDRESFLVFYFVLALFCAGSGSIIGVDDLLVGFSAGVGFSNDGWFTQKTEESHVSNVIDLLLNLAYFVYLGTVIPWEQYNNAAIYLTPWRLVVLAIFVILFRRIPIMLALKPLIPDIKTWREALFAGHFGPIGVGAIFVAILARAALETGGATPLATIPEGESFDGNALLIAVIWPITTFLVISSILVHGSSIAVFTLGKHINTLTLTMSYTTAHEDGPGWINRLPRITSVSRSQAKTIGSETDAEDVKLEDLPPGTLPPIGLPGHFLRRQREEDNPSRQGSRASSLIPRRRKKRWDDGLGPGGPISESAIFPQRRSQSAHLSEQTSETLTTGDSPKMEHTGKDDDEEKHEGELGEVQHDPEMEEIMHRDDDRGDQHKSDAERHPYEREIYVEGDDVIMENEDGDVTNIQEIHPKEHRTRNPEDDSYEEVEKEKLGYKNLRKKLGVWRHKDEDPHGGELRPSGKQTHKTHGPALAYQYGNTIIVEDEDGEVVKTYQLPPNQNVVRPPKETGEEGPVRQGISRVGTWTGLGGKKPDASSAESKFSPPNEQPINSNVRQGIRMGNWGFSGKNDAGEGTSKRPAAEDSDSEDDRRIRFTIGGAGRRLTKEDFLREIQSLDPKARSEIVEQSDAPPSMKAIAKRDADKNSPGSNRLFSKDIQAASGAAIAKTIGAEMAKMKGVDVDSTTSPAPAKPKPAYVKSSRESESSSSSSISPAKKASNSEMTETAAERRRREQALKGVEDVTPAQRGDPTSRTRDRNPSRIDPQMETSSRGRSPPKPSKVTGEEESETAAERKRREAALGVRLEEEDSDDDDTPRVPPPVKSRGIRFATSPVRGRH